MLPSLTLAFVVGLFIGSTLPYFPLSSVAFLALFALSSVVAERRGAIDVRRSTAAFCFLLSGALFWMWMVERPGAIAHWEGDEALTYRVAGRIVVPVQQGPDRLTLLVDLDMLEDHPAPPIRIRLTWRAPDRLVFQGDRIAFRTKLRAPNGSMNPGGFDYAAYLDRQGIQAVASVSGAEGVALLEPGRASWRWSVWNQIDRWRGSIRLAAIQSLTQPALGLFLGIIIGDRGYLEQDLRDRFMVTGTVHLLSISGSHLGLVALLLFVIVRRLVLSMPAGVVLGMSRRMTATRLAALVTILPVCAYAGLAGAELATVRSLIMILVALLTRWLGYGHRLPHALAIAALMMVLQDPQVLYDISFQLSFLSVTVIALWLARSSGTEERRSEVPSTTIRQAAGWCRDGVMMSATITLVTVPLVAFYFNQMPWLGLFTNVIAVPIMGFVLVPIGLWVSVWQLFGSLLLLPFPGQMEWLLNGFVDLIGWMSLIPGGEWHVASPSLPVLFLYYGCLILVWMVGNRPVVVGTVWLLVASLLAWWAWSPRLSSGGEGYRVTFLDVGQGDSAVLELPGGQVVLIDGGATYERFDMGRGVVAPFLWNRGIRSIDHVVVTHPQLDHAGGLVWVLRHFHVGRLWSNGDTREEAFYQRLKQAAATQEVMELVGRAGEEIVAGGGCRMVVVSPSPEAAEVVSDRLRPAHGLNNRSLVTQLGCGETTMIFAADVEKDALSALVRPDSRPVDVLKVPHHGAMSSLHEGWIAAVKPRYALFSAGRHNPYGHPAPAVLGAYAAVGSRLLRTDRDGAVWITGTVSGSSLDIHRTKEQRMVPVDFAASLWRNEWDNWVRGWRQLQDRL